MYWDQNLAPVLAGAEAVTNNDDFSQFTFTLRQDAVFSNGDPIVAADYIRSIRRLADPRIASDYGYMSCFIAGTDALSTCGGEAADGDAVDTALEGIGATAVDDHTLQIDLVQPATFFLSVMAMWLFVPLHESMASGELFDEAEGYIGSGPYRMESWAHDSQIVLVGNENWWGGPVPTNKVQLGIGGDPDAALALYEQGGLDMVPVPGPQVRRILDDPTLSTEAVQLEAHSITYYNFALCGLPNELNANRCPNNAGTGNGEGPTQNLNFRIALTQSVDKQRLIDFLRGGLGTPAYTYVMPGIPGADEELNTNPPYPYDTAAAGTALSTALTELEVSNVDGSVDADGNPTIDGADLGALKLIYNTDAGHLPYIAFLAEAWRTSLGLLDLELVGVDFPTLLEIRGNGENDIARNGWGADFSHAHNQLNDLYRCQGGNNDGNYCNPAFDDLMDEAAQTVDLDAQTQLYLDAQEILVNDVASLPLFFPVATYLLKPWVQGEVVTTSDHTNPGDQLFETIVISGRE
jgi:oligopeptide transport system substrate-binding protein